MYLALWFAHTLIFAVINYTEIRKNQNPIHWLNAAITVLLAGMLCWFESRPLWFAIPCFLLTYWFLFDTLLNLMRGLPVFYLGDASVLDRLQKQYGGVWPWFVWKAILFVGFTLSYFFNF